MSGFGPVKNSIGIPETGDGKATGMIKESAAPF
jgi:hypothetical protein